jgi:hypothetical protein
MHDIDRTQLETGELESELSHEHGEIAETRDEFGSQESPLNELQEVEFATELLEVGSEAELEQFFGGLLSKVGQTVGKFVRSDTGRALGGILKNAAKQALPVVGRGIGQWVSPQRGGAIGASAGRLAGQILGLELEGMSQEDREFEVARQFVRFAATAARQAALDTGRAPLEAARRAAAVAAQLYAPGLLRRLPGRSSLVWPRSGRWVRRGKVIVLYGG